MSRTPTSAGRRGWGVIFRSHSPMQHGPSRGVCWGAWVLGCLPPSALRVGVACTRARRIFGGESWWEPQVAHAYQRWAKGLWGHFPVTFAYAAWAVAGGLLAGGIRDLPDAFIMCAGSAWYLGGGILWLRLQSHYGRKSGLPGKQSG